MKLTPAAATLTSSWPGPGTGRLDLCEVQDLGSARLPGDDGVRHGVSFSGPGFPARILSPS